MEKKDEYAVKIVSKIGELFNDDDENCDGIEISEFEEGDNLTDFIFALSVTVPTLFYRKFTSEEKTNVEVNHIANRLILQNAIKDAVLETKKTTNKL